MKKLIVLAAGLLLVNTSKAQYFQHVYGDVPGAGPNGIAFVNKEFNTRSIPYSLGGQVLCGTSSYAEDAWHWLHGARVDQNGNLPNIPYFNYGYRLLVQFQGGATAAQTYGSSVVEVSEREERINLIFAGHGVFDLLHGFYEKKPFLLKTDDAGAVQYVRYYDLQEINGYDFESPVITLSNDKTKIYMAGTANSGNIIRPYAFSINTSDGTVNWGRIYTFSDNNVESNAEVVKDIMVNPYREDELVIVGGSKNKALLFTIDANNGATNSAKNYAINVNGQQLFNSINKSNTQGFAQPFIIGGQVDLPKAAAANMDMWTLLLSLNGDLGFCTTHNFADNTIAINNTCVDFIERFSTEDNSFRYHAVGTIENLNNINTNDIQLLQLGSNGKCLTNGQTIFGQVATDESAQSINFPLSGDLTVCGNLDDGNNKGDALLINSYKNGVTACRYQNGDLLSEEKELNIGRLEFSNAGIGISVLIDYDMYNLANQTICSEPSVNGGNNLRPSASTGLETLQLNDAISIYPNPSAGNFVINCTGFETEKTSVTITDISGKQVYVSTISQEKTTVTLNHVEDGIYLVTISNGQNSYKQKMIISHN